MATVYIETSIVSYLRPRPSSDVVARARQVLTRRWWDEQRPQYELVTSQLVVAEARAGHHRLAAERLSALAGLPLLELTRDAASLGEALVDQMILPRMAEVDALHIALAACNRIDYLLTWNCRHIANATVWPRLRTTLADMNYWVPTICTPEEMVRDGSDYR